MRSILTGNLKNFISGTILLAFVFVQISCRNVTDNNEKHLLDEFPRASAHNEIASFIAGTSIHSDSLLKTITSDQRYVKYASEIDVMWKSYSEKNMARMAEWRKENLYDFKNKILFYPFSGPDILNAMILFPNVNQIIMIGLEQPGELPNFSQITPDKIIKDLYNVKRSLRTILQLNLFRTLEMMSDLSPSSYNSVTGIMLFFLNRSGFSILEFQKIYLVPTGEIVKGVLYPQQGSIPGVEIIFKKKGGEVKRVTYFSLDLSDSGLANKPWFLRHISALNGCATFLKSASYLLSYDNFATLRKFILQNNEYIVQEDSGIPLRFYSKNDWNISFYGNYRVLDMFKNRFQPDLSERMKKESKGQLQFSIGYGFVPEKSSLMVSRRKKK